MQLNEINLNKIKVVIFNFNDTLAIYKDKDYAKCRKQNEDNLINYYSNAYLKPTSFFETIEPCSILKPLQNFIKIYEKNNI